jgi:hypothetical protein
VTDAAGAADAVASSAAPEGPRAFSASGGALFRSANSALERLARAGAGAVGEHAGDAGNDEGTRGGEATKDTEGTTNNEADENADASEDTVASEDMVADASAESAGAAQAAGSAEGAAAAPERVDVSAEDTVRAPGDGADGAVTEDAAEPAADGGPRDDHGPQDDPPARAPRQRSAEDAAAAADTTVRDSAVHGPADAAAPAPGAGAPLGRPSGPGHFTVPTAVAVVPAEAPRRPSVQGGFDFFGTQKTAPEHTADSVRNEDLADVVGQEALALHKAEAESGFKPAGPEVRAGQVIDLTAHDETEQIDIEGLRSAAS